MHRDSDPSSAGVPGGASRPAVALDLRRRATGDAADASARAVGHRRRPRRDRAPRSRRRPGPRPRPDRPGAAARARGGDGPPRGAPERARAAPVRRRRARARLPARGRPGARGRRSDRPPRGRPRLRVARRTATWRRRRWRWRAASPLTPAAFRDATGTSRRYVMAILEDLDRRGILRRTPDRPRAGPRAPAWRPDEVTARRRSPGIVLAGGARARFGRTSWPCELDGRPLLDHAVDGRGAVAPTSWSSRSPRRAVPEPCCRRCPPRAGPRSDARSRARSPGSAAAPRGRAANRADPGGRRRRRHAVARSPRCWRSCMRGARRSVGRRLRVPMRGGRRRPLPSRCGPEPGRDAPRPLCSTAGDEPGRALIDRLAVPGSSSLSGERWSDGRSTRDVDRQRPARRRPSPRTCRRPRRRIGRPGTTPDIDETGDR